MYDLHAVRIKMPRVKRETRQIKPPTAPPMWIKNRWMTAVIIIAVSMKQKDIMKRASRCLAVIDKTRKLGSVTQSRSAMPVVSISNA
jgi:hypothetical protein